MQQPKLQGIIFCEPQNAYKTENPVDIIKKNSQSWKQYLKQNPNSWSSNHLELGLLTKFLCTTMLRHREFALSAKNVIHCHKAGLPWVVKIFYVHE